MIKLKIIIILSLSLFSQIIFAKEKTYIRDYSYQASDTDSKVSARNASLLFLKQKLLSEIGTYVDSNINIFKSSSGSSVSSQQIKSLTEGFIRTEIIDEKWNGVTFYIKARMLADSEEIAKKLKSLYGPIEQEQSENNEEFEYWKSVVLIDKQDAYKAYMVKYPSGKYKDLAEIAITHSNKKKTEEKENNKWLVRNGGHITLVVRHDTGTFEDLDSDKITNELGNTSLSLIKRYAPANTKYKVIEDFDQSETFQFNHKNRSQEICKSDETNLVAGVMLEDLEGVTGIYRPFRMFMYDCTKAVFKLTHFIPSGSSPKDFWREKSVRKNLRLFIQDYLDSI